MKILNSLEEIKKWAESTPLIPSGDIRILYDLERYDGPLQGIVLWKNQRFYFYAYENQKEEMARSHERIYAIIQMTPEQDEEDKYWQAQLIDWVGIVNEYDENSDPIQHAPTNPVEHNKFWKEYQVSLKPYKLTQGQVLGRWILNFRPGLDHEIVRTSG